MLRWFFSRKSISMEEDEVIDAKKDSQSKGPVQSTLMSSTADQQINVIAVQQHQQNLDVITKQAIAGIAENMVKVEVKKQNVDLIAKVRAHEHLIGNLTNQEIQNKVHIGLLEKENITLKSELADLRVKLNNTEAQLSATINQNKTDLQRENNLIRVDLQGEINQNKNDLQRENSELKTNLQGTINQNMASLQRENNQIRADLREQIASLRVETWENTSAVNTSLSQQIDTKVGELRGQISAENGLLNSRITNVESLAEETVKMVYENSADIVQDKTDLQREVSELNTDLQGQINQNKTDLQREINAAGEENLENVETVRAMLSREIAAKTNRGDFDLLQRQVAQLEGQVEDVETNIVNLQTNIVDVDQLQRHIAQLERREPTVINARDTISINTAIAQGDLRGISPTWYICANGHYYLVGGGIGGHGSCSAPTEDGRCVDCGLGIGQGSGNTVADDMNRLYAAVVPAPAPN